MGLVQVTIISLQIIITGNGRNNIIYMMITGNMHSLPETLTEALQSIANDPEVESSMKSAASDWWITQQAQ